MARWVFPTPGGSEEDHVLPAVEEGEFVQGVDLLALDGGLEAEVEVGQGLHGREPRGTNGGLEPAVVAQVDLGSEELLESNNARWPSTTVSSRGIS